MVRFPLLLGVAIVIVLGPVSSQEVKFARYPNVSNGGDLAFSYHGDIWVLDKGATRPRRLTAHVARDTSPRWSPDGSTIAFTSNRMGNNDVWLVPGGGGEPRQLTFHSTGDNLTSWTPDGTGVLVSTSRGAGAWGSPLYVVPLDGSIPTPLPMDRGASGMLHPDGNVVAFNRIGFRYWRKSYRGNNNTDIFVQDLRTKQVRQLTDNDPKAYRQHTQDAHPMWGADGKIYFMSERDGTFNIWRIRPDGGEPEQVTRHASDGVQYPSISPDGRTIAYENEFQLWSLSVPDGKPVRIPIAMDFDPKDNLVSWVSSDGNADGFAPSPDGSRIAVDFHGEIVVVPADPKVGEKSRITQSPARDRYQVWSPDNRFLAWISDASGDEEIWIQNLEDGTSRQLTRHPSTKRSMIFSPDSRRLVFTAANRLFSVDIASRKTEELAHNPEGGYSLSSFTADGAWLVYSRSDANLNSEVYLFDLANKTEHNVTRHRARERGGRVTPDGKSLVFSSDRNGGNTNLFVVSLSRMTEDPNDPLVRARKAKEKPKQRKGRKSEGDDEDKEEKKPEVGAVKIDPEGIDVRARQLTRGEDRIGSFFLSKDGKTVYYTRGRALHSIGLDGEKGKKVADGSFSRLTMTADKKTFVFQDGGKLHTMPVKGGKKSAVAFDFKVKVDQRAEWAQVFNEAWRVMKYRFYDPDMHGVDWEAMRKRYEPLLAYVGENQDLYDLTNEMIGELNASHTGVSGPPSRSMERAYTTRLLGFEMAPLGRYYGVTHVYPKGPADKEWIDLKPGDLVLSIDGTEIKAGDNYWKLLNHVLNDYVTVGVSRPKGGGNGSGAVPGEVTKVRIKTITSLRNLKYEAWVESRRKIVDELSGGKVGYVHIRSMNRSSLARFETEIDQFWNKNGMIVDIRYNGGGNIDQQLIDILERRPYEYWNSRWGGRARGRRPRQCIAGPKVMLINWRSASDSEVTPQGFRDLGLGRIVGNPTYGAVIATGSYRLMNGGRIRTPGSLVVTYDPTKPHNYGINLENFGVAPDVWVENSPLDEIAGRDRELEAAVKEAQRMLAEGTWQFGEDK